MIINQKELKLIYINNKKEISVAFANDTPYISLINSHKKEFSNLNYVLNIGIFRVLPENFRLEDYVPQKIIDGLCSLNKLHLIICNHFEASTTILPFIYEILVKKYNIPTNKISCLTGNYDLNNYNLKLSSELGVEPINLYFCNIFEYKVHTNIQEIPFEPLKLEQKIYPNTFLMFNRKWRLHRIYLLALIKALNLDKNALISFNTLTDKTNDWAEFIGRIEAALSENEYCKQVLEKNVRWKSFNDLILDTNDLVLNRAALTSKDIPYKVSLQLYKDTYFSLVTETVFFTDGSFYFLNNENEYNRFLTEKTFKPIFYNHPFILVSRPFTLELLKKIGYKTFHPYIDESYDSITDDLQRLEKITIEVNRLANLTEEEQVKFVQNVLPIVEHNFEVLKRRNIRDFIIKLGD